MLYEFFRTDREGTAIEHPHLYTLNELRFSTWDWPGHHQTLEHLIDIATRNPGHPVDLVKCRGCAHCDTPTPCTGLLYSARLIAHSQVAQVTRDQWPAAQPVPGATPAKTGDS